MARRTFFSFQYDDVFRANQVRQSNVVVGADVAGFFDHSEYTKAKSLGLQAIQRMILKHLESTSVTVVLIGTHTASRPWVCYEIEESIKRKNGLLGIRIHNLKNGGLYGITSPVGPAPVVPPGVVFPTYVWDGDARRLADAIEAAGQRSDALKRRPTTILGGWARG